MERCWHITLPKFPENWCKRFYSMDSKTLLLLDMQFPRITVKQSNTVYSGCGQICPVWSFENRKVLKYCHESFVWVDLTRELINTEQGRKVTQTTAIWEICDADHSYLGREWRRLRLSGKTVTQTTVIWKGYDADYSYLGRLWCSLQVSEKRVTHTTAIREDSDADYSYLEREWRGLQLSLFISTQTSC